MIVTTHLPLPLTLHMPARWFELDYPLVKKAKLKALTDAGAQMKPGQTGVAYPLQAESYSLTGNDLVERGWAAKLCMRGLDPAQPTVWLAEGVLNHLMPTAALAALLSCAAVRKSPGHGVHGSFVVQLTVTGIDDVW